MRPNITKLNELYKKGYEGTGRNMFGCWPVILGKVPDWATWDFIWRCVNYTPSQTDYMRHLAKWDYLYKGGKPFVDICIGTGTVVTTIGVIGKILLASVLHVGIILHHFFNLCN